MLDYHFFIVPDFILGLLFGSFLGVVGYRVPRGESIVWPRSHCPACERQLTAFELIPVLSWVCLHARCRSCDAPISVRYPCIELTCGVLFTATLMSVQTPWKVAAWSVFWMLMLAVTVTDLTAMRVPNVLSLPGAVIVFGLFACTGVQTWKSALFGAIVGAGVLFAIHLLSGGRMGMGDVKLYITIGAVLGPVGSVESLLVASISGSIIGILLRAMGLLKKREYMPFVPHIAVGVIVTVFFGTQVIHWYTTTLLGLSN